MIDYLIISKFLMDLIHSVLVDFSTEWSPHYGIELELMADALVVMNLVLMQPSFPKNLDEYDAKLLEENSLQDKEKPKGNIERKATREANMLEMQMRNANHGNISKEFADNIPVRSVLTTVGNTTSSAVEAYLGKMMGEEIDQNKPTKNLAIWCQTLQQYRFTRCGDEQPTTLCTAWDGASGG